MAEIQHVRMTLPAGTAAERAERVSRMIFDHLQRTMALEPSRERTRVVPQLAVPPLEIDWNDADDEHIARTGAAWIYRWLKAAE